MDPMTALMTQYRMQPQSHRTGQAYFNAAYALWPDVADKARGTDVDPFYDDSKIGAFCVFIMERVSG